MLWLRFFFKLLLFYLLLFKGPSKQQTPSPCLTRHCVFLAARAANLLHSSVCGSRRVAEGGLGVFLWREEERERKKKGAVRFDTSSKLFHYKHIQGHKCLRTCRTAALCEGLVFCVSCRSSPPVLLLTHIFFSPPPSLTPLTPFHPPSRINVAANNNCVLCIVCCWAFSAATY